MLVEKPDKMNYIHKTINLISVNKTLILLTWFRLVCKYTSLSMCYKFTQKVNWWLLV